MTRDIDNPHSSVIIYNSAKMVKENSLKAYDYFVYLLEEIPN